MEKIITQEMTQKEINESIKLLKLCIKENKINYTRYNPTQDNCYTSSSDIIGIYFPNTIFIKCQPNNEKESKNYELCALSKVGGELGIIQSLKDDTSEELKRYFAPYKFISFDMFLYGQHYKAIKRGILQDIECYTERLNFLEGIKRISKKNGEDFQDVTKNFVNVSIALKLDWLSQNHCDKVVLYKMGQEITLYRKDNDKEQNANPSANEIESLINEEIARVKGYINEWRKDLDNLPKDFRKFERVAASLKEFRKTCNHWTYYDNELRYMII